jgi:hypothetical protein
VLVPRDEPADEGAPERGVAAKLRSAAGRLASAVGHQIAKAARVVVKNADKSVFPGSLLLVVGGFLAVQNQIDRRDPKLALAPTSADTDLEFDPLPA